MLVFLLAGPDMPGTGKFILTEKINTSWLPICWRAQFRAAMVTNVLTRNDG